MMTRDTRGQTTQANLFKPLLRDIVSRQHPLVLLADSIDWKSFEDALESRFCADNGRPSCPVRLMVGLQYLKYTAGLSDDGVLAEWCENPLLAVLHRRHLLRARVPHGPGVDVALAQETFRGRGGEAA